MQIANQDHRYWEHTRDDDVTQIDQCLYEIKLQCSACNSAYEWAMSFDDGTEQRSIALDEYRREVKKMDGLKSRLADLKN